MNVLVVKLSAIGDVIHALPAVNYLKGRLPAAAKITWVVEPLSADLLRNNPLVDNLIVFKKKEIAGGSFSELRKLLGQLFEQNYEAALDFQGLFKSAALCKVSNAKRVFGFAGAREMAPLFYTDKVDTGDYFSYKTHVVVHNLRLANAAVAALGGNALTSAELDSEAKFLKFPLRDDSTMSDLVAKLPEQLIYRSTTGGAAPLVVLIPGTTWVTKLWPATYWAELGGKLASSANVRLALVGGPGEKTANQEIADGIRRIKPDVELMDLTGQTGLGDLIGLFSLTKLVIGGDTGPLHLASAVTKPGVIGIYGSTPIGRNGPFGAHCKTLSTALDCQPCFSKTCRIGTLACLNDLSPDMVLAVALESLTSI